MIWRGEHVLRNPTNAELAQVIGLYVAPSTETRWDLVVVGAGPAGLAASVYAASEGLATITLDAVRDRRPGRDVAPHRKLPGLSFRDLGRRTGRPGRNSGRKVRGPDRCAGHRGAAGGARWLSPGRAR